MSKIDAAGWGIKRNGFRKVQEGSVKIANKSRDLYRSIKKNVKSKIGTGQKEPAASTKQVHNPKSLVLSSQPQSPPVSETQKATVGVVNYTHVSQSEVPLNAKLIQRINELLYELGTDIWADFFDDPREPAKYTVDAANDTEWIGYGDISMSPYDTAWIAMIPDPRYKETKAPGDFKLVFPECFTWLLQAQDDKGSWARTGAGSIAPALAALLAMGLFKSHAGPLFKQKLNEINVTQQKFDTVFDKGVAFLRNTLNEWNIDDIDMTGFELIIPYHMSELEKLEPPVVFDFPEKQRLLEANKLKMGLIPIEKIFALAAKRQPITIVHSLEALLGVVDFSRFQNPGFQAINGSYGSSPAATAAVLISAPKWDHKACDYLRKVVAKRPRYAGMYGYAPTLCDIGPFETTWVMHCVGEMVLGVIRDPRTNFDHPLIKEMTANVRSVIEFMKGMLEEQGGTLRWVSWDNRIPPDVDDTGVSNYLISEFDSRHSVDINLILKIFWNGHYFLSFPRERTFSVSCNVHMMTLLMSEREKARKKLIYPIMVETKTETGTEKVNIDEIILSTVEFIRSQRNKNQVWLDKWNVSPWYTTMKSIQLLLSLQTYPDLLYKTSFGGKAPLLDFCRKSVDHALSKQHSDGSWGEQSDDAIGNMEETSYAMRLLRIAAVNWPEDEQVHAAIEKGREYLLLHLDESMTDPRYFYGKQPYLWINKQLYMPSRIVRASILVALWDDLNSRSDPWNLAL